MDIQIPTIPLREHQKDVFSALTTGPFKRGLYIAHRRSGKDIVALEIALANALMGKPGMILYFNPTYAQIKQTIWNGIADNGQKILDMVIPKQLIVKKNNSEMYIELINGSVIKFLGSDSYNTSAVGANCKMAIFSEWSLCDPLAWAYTRPILTMNGGKAFFIGTPRSKNHMYEMYESTKKNKEWFVRLRGYKNTGLMTDDEYEKEIADGMSEALAAQEFLCSFDTANEGSYFGKTIQAMRKDNRITSLPIDDFIKVNTSWDLGYSDSTAIIFYQKVGEFIHIIDCFESNGASLKEYVKVLREKGYIYEKHYFPHDIQVHELGSGETRLNMLEGMGLYGDVVPQRSISYGIECVHRLLVRTKINEDKCGKLIKALEMYQKKFDEKNNVFLEQPLHNEYSHLVDAVRMLAVAERESLNAQIGEFNRLSARKQEYNPVQWNKPEVKINW